MLFRAYLSMHGRSMCRHIILFIFNLHNIMENPKEVEVNFLINISGTIAIYSAVAKFEEK